jgi:hypothetical protein
MKPLISLIDHVGLGLILEFPSGVIYSNQTGGTSCLHPELEGVFIPLRNDCVQESREFLSPEHVLFAYFGGPKWRGTGATKGIDSEDADFIDQLLAKYRLAHCITTDRSRLRDSQEAWVWVQVTSDEDVPELGAFVGFAPYPRSGVLTWQNTD